MTVNPKALARSATADPIRPKFSIKVTNFPSFISFHYKLSIESVINFLLSLSLAKFAFAAEEQQPQPLRNIKSFCFAISKKIFLHPFTVFENGQKITWWNIYLIPQCLKCLHGYERNLKPHPWVAPDPWFSCLPWPYWPTKRSVCKGWESSRGLNPPLLPHHILERYTQRFQALLQPTKQLKN